jgi:hypothetical protein
VAQSKNCPFGNNITIGQKNMTTTSNNHVFYRGIIELTSLPVLSDVVVTFFQLNRNFNPTGHFLDCATVAFSEIYYDQIAHCARHCLKQVK